MGPSARSSGSGSARGLPGAALALLLNALGGQPPLNHQRPLRLKDGQGGAWQLANRSQELVPEGAAPLPPASAQFDVEGLEPAPRGFLPLRLQGGCPQSRAWNFMPI